MTDLLKFKFRTWLYDAVWIFGGMTSVFIAASVVIYLIHLIMWIIS